MSAAMIMIMRGFRRPLTVSLPAWWHPSPSRGVASTCCAIHVCLHHISRCGLAYGLIWYGPCRLFLGEHGREDQIARSFVCTCQWRGGNVREDNPIVWLQDRLLTQFLSLMYCSARSLPLSPRRTPLSTSIVILSHRVIHAHPSTCTPALESTDHAS